MTQWVDATILGCSIGVAVVVLELLLGEAALVIRVGAFLVVGVLLCVLQYVLLQRNQRNK